MSRRESLLGFTQGPDAALGDCACKDEYIQLLIFVLGAGKQTSKPNPAETMLTTVTASPAVLLVESFQSR